MASGRPPTSETNVLTKRSVILVGKALSTCSSQSLEGRSRLAYLFRCFITNTTSSGKFCGVAEMVGPVDLTAHAGCWSDKRWRGRFAVQWKIVKDVLNSDLRHFRIV